MLSKYAHCPNCDANWNAGDIKRHLRGLSVFLHKSDYEIEKVAKSYGWRENKQTKFSITSGIILEDGREFVKCPNMRCGHIFNVNTGEEYDSIYSLYDNEPIENEHNSRKAN